MDYEKKYKEALSRAAAMLKVADNEKEAMDYISTIFPELAESEDERIRKDIMVLVKDWWDRVNKDNISTKEQMIAWLKKQGELTQSVTKISDKGWSEEDEQYLLVCKNALAKYQTTDKWDAHIIFHWLENKLKFIKP